MKMWKQCVLALGIGVAISANLVRSADAPGLSMTLASSNQISLTITNGAATNFYEIDRRQSFDDLHPWTFESSGTQGQTNFTAEMGDQQTGFFRAIACTDCDLDGIENWRDAAPNDASIGLLAITIDSPTNGSNIQ